MNETDVPSTPTERQQAYLRHLAARAHDAGMPHLQIASFTRAQASEWIDYLKQVVGEEEPTGSSPYVVTPPRDRLPPSYRPPWRELPDDDDHEHLVGTITRADGEEQSLCVTCGVSI